MTLFVCKKFPSTRTEQLLHNIDVKPNISIPNYLFSSKYAIQIDRSHKHTDQIHSSVLCYEFH